MAKWQDFLLVSERYHKYQLDSAKKSKIDWGEKYYATFSDFSFWALPDQKMAGSKKNGWQNFSTIIVLL